LKVDWCVIYTMIANRVSGWLTGVVRTIVIRSKQARGAFDKAELWLNYLPREEKYELGRKPPLPHWSDPAVVYPRVIPPLTTKSKAFQLLEL
jgi:hypothetical protein